MEKDPNHERFLALLALARKKIGNDSRVAEALNVKPAHISQWKSGKHRVPPHTVELLSQLVREEKYPAPKTDGFILDERREKKFERFINKMKFALAPIIMFVRAGEEAYPEDLEHAAAKIAVPCDDPNCYVVDVVGDSMMPIYKEGDFTGDRAEPGSAESGSSGGAQAGWGSVV